ncbi:hypothetical protein HELRODRAFT_179832 [Helobdella robusta]|uniref:Uncharacterized protein n=1 Tax=Helobdella robusta TaxID=6412 RepID=T1FF70_HELRO|nr:hypothetical protein HELRODRAFT_179832 [Helobdella robusta]ESN94988.1 hypothetical protein HELRODRAFT_179832 [Helobdella robusta]
MEWNPRKRNFNLEKKRQNTLKLIETQNHPLSKSSHTATTNAGQSPSMTAITNSISNSSVSENSVRSLPSVNKLLATTTTSSSEDFVDPLSRFAAEADERQQTSSRGEASSKTRQSVDETALLMDNELVKKVAVTDSVTKG